LVEKTYGKGKRKEFNEVSGKMWPLKRKAKTLKELHGSKRAFVPEGGRFATSSFSNRRRCLDQRRENLKKRKKL